MMLGSLDLRKFAVCMFGCLEHLKKLEVCMFGCLELRKELEVWCVDVCMFGLMVIVVCGCLGVYKSSRKLDRDGSAEFLSLQI